MGVTVRGHAREVALEGKESVTPGLHTPKKEESHQNFEFSRIWLFFHKVLGNTCLAFAPKQGGTRRRILESGSRV